MKRNTYTLEQMGDATSLRVYLGPRKAKVFDYGIARHKNRDGLFTWNGTYSDNPQAKEMFEGRLEQLKKLNIRRDRKAERNGIK